MLRKLLLLSLLCLPLAAQMAGPAVAAEAPLTIGLGVGISTSEYRQMDATVLPLPFINYEGERFFLRGFTGGLHLFKNDMHEVSLTVSYLPQSYDASESGSRAMRRLDDRYSTMLAGAGYALTTRWGTARLSASGDVLGTSDGIIVDGSYAYPLTFGRVNLTPSLGVTWTSEHYNDYYYGISGKESRKSGYGTYDPDSGFSPYAGVNAKVDIGYGFGLMMNGKAKYLSDEIRDSPMVTRDMTLSFGAGLTYSF